MKIMKQNETLKIDGVLSLVGNTPLLKLSKFFNAAHFDVHAKLEMFNPGGSVKDRAALNMIMDAWNKGIIDKDSTIIESSSGNTGVALAQACAYLGLKFICVVDIHSQVINRNIIKTYGGSIDLVEKPHPERGFLGARLDRIQHLLKTIPNSFNCDQYRNKWHPLSHRQTVKEILRDLGKEPDYIFIALSTCGTIRGISETVRAQKLKTKIIAVDAEGSVIFGQKPKKRLIPGHGASIVPPFYYKGVCDDYVHVSDMDCISGCRQLVRREGLFIGGSSGGIITAVQKFAHKIPKGSTCVLMLADRGGRYLDSVYSDDWVMKNYGMLPVDRDYQQLVAAAAT